MMEYIEAMKYEASQYILSLPQGINMSIRKLFTSTAVFSDTVLSQSAAGVEDLDGPGRDLYGQDLSACPGSLATNHHETRSGFSQVRLAMPTAQIFPT
jgi:alpha-glucosidase